jgi:protocatechuate 3,4-dioxygenase beta subunit
MKYLSFALGLVLLGGLCTGGARAQTTRSGPATAIPGLEGIVKNLGSADFAQREAAQKDLEQIPAAEYEALSQFAARLADEEVKSRIRMRVTEMVWELAQVKSDAPLRAAGHITGRVLDEMGKPIAGATANAYLPDSRGIGLQALLPGALTDAQGRFDVGVPFLEARYMLAVDLSGMGGANVNVVAAKNTSAGDLVMKRGATRTLRGSLVDSAGKPVALQEVQIVGNYGVIRSISTDTQGHFSIDGLPSFLGQPVAIVHAGNQTTPLAIIRADDLPLKLVEAGSLSGKVVGDKGQPLSGATVIAQPWFASGVELRAKTAADGTYTIPDVPPGQWLVSAEAPAYSRRPPQERYSDLPKINVGSGATATANIRMERMAVAYGRVIDQAGRAVAGAVLKTKTTWQRNDSDAWRLVQTDDQGRFFIGTGQTARPDRPAENQLLVFSAQDGSTTLPLRDLAPGEIRELTVKLPGSLRVSGRIVDPARKPIPDINCGYTIRTDAEGRFDLGRISRAAEGVTELQLIPPPLAGTTLGVAMILVPAPGTTRPQPDIVPDTRVHYVSRKIPLPATGDATDLKITLQPARMLEFTGIVRDAQGQPMADASVYALVGNVKADSWLRQVRPDLGPMGSWVDTYAANSARTGPDGRYTVRCMRGEGDSVEVQEFSFDFAHLALGVYSDGQAKLIEKIAVPKTGAVETNIQMGNP